MEAPQFPRSGATVLLFSNGNFSAAVMDLIGQLDLPIVRKGGDDPIVVDRSIHGGMRDHH